MTDHKAAAERLPATPAPEADLLRAVLQRDEAACREMVRRYDGELRAVVRHAAEATSPLTDDQIDDVLGDFWLRIVADDFRMLRAFDPSRSGAALFTWLTFQVAHVVHQYLRRIGREPETVPLDHARNVPGPPAPAPSLRSERTRAEAERALISDLADFLVAVTLDGKLADNDVDDGNEGTLTVGSDVYTVDTCPEGSSPQDKTGQRGFE
jgi:DNA-directed RNA polymerase specialized sigma24 family protein